MVKRVRNLEEEHEKEEVEDQFDVEGLLDAEASSDENSDSSDEEELSEDEKTQMGFDHEESVSDSEELEDKELEKLIGSEEEDDEDDEEFSETVPELYASDSGSDSDEPERFVLGADGKPRLLKPEIIPVYDSDDSDGEEPNTIGNVPLSAYDEFPHIGYDIDGKRIMRPATGSALDSLLESIELPEGWTGMLDKNTGKSLNISGEELALIKRIQRGENTNDETNPYEDTVEWFTSQKEIMPLSAAPEPKRRFIPSKDEAKKVMKIVKAIREGRIVPNKPKPAEDERQLYDIWADNDAATIADVMHFPAPKLPPPTHEESYNPPEEYLPDDKELEEWAKLEPSERRGKVLSKKFDALRKVPGYSESIRERFERSLDLYLAPRMRKTKLNIDPDSLIPDLPSPKDLRPFPIKCSTIFKGHKGKVRTLSIDSTGQFLATGGDDGTLRVWEVLTGRELWRVDVMKGDDYEDDEADGDENEDESNSGDYIDCIAWNPTGGFLAVAGGNSIYLVVPPVFDLDIENKAYETIDAGWGYSTGGQESTQDKITESNGGDDVDSDDDDEEDDGPVIKKKSIAKWTKPGKKLTNSGVSVAIRTKHTVKKISWHRRGDYLVSVSPQGANSAVLVHQLSKHSSQSPFKKSKGIVQHAMFHPFRPHLYVGTQRYVRIYDLAAQELTKKLQPGVRWLSSFDIHPRGDNVLISSYDKKVTWHDLDLSTKPYKTLRYHKRAVRDVEFHKGGLPLFCSVSDDGDINVFHGSVYDDLMKNPLLVPLKVLKGHKVTNNLGVLDGVWHPKEAWLFTAGADGTARLWTA